jgi:hypothetical protein
VARREDLAYDGVPLDGPETLAERVGELEERVAVLEATVGEDQRTLILTLADSVKMLMDSGVWRPEGKAAADGGK